jgi:hypothetical protein
VDAVDDAKVADADSITILVSLELFDAGGRGSSASANNRTSMRFRSFFERDASCRYALELSWTS